MRRFTYSLFLLLAACPAFQAPAPNQLQTFQVRVLGVFSRQGTNRLPASVVKSCVEQYGSADAVPTEAKGRPDCQYLIPPGEVEFDIEATAMGMGEGPLPGFSGAVSWRVIPGDVVPELQARWGLMNNGVIQTTVRAVHPYGAVRVWIEDAPPKLLFDAGSVDVSMLPPEPVAPFQRTYAAGASPEIHFADQSLQSLQMPGVLDNRSSPFAGEFVVVGKNPGSGQTLKQACTDDPSRNGRDALMVVTGLDPSGFFVTDVSACRIREMLADNTGSSVRTPEPNETCWQVASDGTRVENLDGGAGICNISERPCTKRSDCPGYSPGNFASMFVYNYNFPEGLDEGDLLFTLSGSVQEFTSTTQMVFPSWTVAERVRQLPKEQWDKWLRYAPPYNLNGRTCGLDDNATPFITDTLCGHNRRNLKMESLESGLVRLRRIRFPNRFENCDFNGNGSVPFFCETRPPGEDWQWSTCSFDAPEPEADRIERVCNMNCVVGMGEHAGTICSERSTFQGFGQFVVEMALPGPSALELDDALSQRMQRLTATASDAGTNPSVRAQGYGQGTELAIACSENTRYRVGNEQVVATETDDELPANQVMRRVVQAGESAVAFQAINQTATCTVGFNSHTRINLVTKDAVPELNPDCDEADADENKAQQCRFLRGAEFNVVGHLRQVQPARPRWVVTPRAPDDVCCYPGPGMQCPRPIQPCPPLSP